MNTDKWAAVFLMVVACYFLGIALRILWRLYKGEDWWQ